VAWHPADRDTVKNALQTAVEALDERAMNFRLILDDRHLYGIIDPDRLRELLASDHAAAEVLQSLLHPTTEPSVG